MIRPCARAWEIEPAHDGRVSGSALQALRQHIDSCEFCSREHAYLESLTCALNDADAASEELTARRMRPVVLSRARAARYQRPHWPLIAALSTVVLSVVLLTAQWLRPPTRRASSVLAIRALSRDTAWTRRVQGDIEYIDVRDGDVSFNVKHRAGDLRLVVHVPDGEIEDLGTVFALQAHAGHTQRIAVSEGVIVFRRSHAASIAIGAGEIWQPPGSTPVVSLPASTPSLTAVAPADCIVRGTASNDSVMPRLSRSKARVTSPQARSRASAVASHQAHAGAGENVADGSAAEDGAYLSIIALSREGRSEEALIAARAYLTSFPNGFRRPEAARLAGLH